MLRRAGVGHERRRQRVVVGPAVEDRRGGVAAPRRPLQPAPAVDPVDLVGQQEQRGQRRGVVGLVGAGVVEGQREAERRRRPAPGGGQPLDPLDGGRRAQRQPQPAVRGEALLGREVVDSRTRRDRPGPRRRPRWRRPARGRRVGVGRAADRRRHAGRGLVVGQGVDVESGWPLASGAVPGSDSMTSGGSRWGAPATAAANLAENSPKERCWLRRSIKPEGGGVPEGRGPAVAEDAPRSPSGRENSVGQAGPHPAHDGPDAGAAVAGAHVAGRPVAARAATASVRTLDGPQPNRPSAGRRSGGIVIWGRCQLIGATIRRDRAGSESGHDSERK